MEEVSTAEAERVSWFEKGTLVAESEAPESAPVTTEAATPDQPTEPISEPEPQIVGPPMPTWQKIAWSVFIAVAVLFFLSGYAPWRIGYPETSPLDMSWLMVLKWAHAHSVDFGHNLIFTFGPWGFVIEGYDPNSYGTMVLAWTFMGAALFLGLIALAREAKSPPPWVGAILLIFIAALLGPNVTQVQDDRMFALSWVLLLVQFYAHDRLATIAKVLLVAAMALAGQIKFDMTALAVGITVIASIDQILKRQWPWLIGWFLAAYVGLWLLAGQSITSLPAFLAHSMNLAGAYTGADSLRGPTEVRDVSLFLSCGVPALILVAVAHWRKWTTMTLMLAGVGFCGLLDFKAGYVRHDLHEMEGTVGLALLLILVSYTLWRWLDWSFKVIALAACLGSLGLAWHSYSEFDRFGLPHELGLAFSEFPARMGTAVSWLGGHNNQAPEYDEMVSKLRDVPGIPEPQGSVDVYPWDQAVVLAHGWDYQPRPVFQSYVAFTTELSEINAAFLRSPSAPDSILFDVKYIQGFPAMEEDAASWPELLTRYDLKDARGQMLLLQKSDSPRKYQIVEGETLTAQFGDTIDVPVRGELVWAKIDVQPSLLGRAMDALYKLPPVAMFIARGSGEVSAFRLLPDVARDGFLLSPFVDSRDGFAMLQEPQWQFDLRDSLVRKIRIMVDAPEGKSAYYQPTFHYSFARLEFPRSDPSEVPGFDQIQTSWRLLHNMRPIMATTRPVVLPQPGGRVVMFVPGHTQLFYFASPLSSSVRVGYGMAEESYTGTIKSAGVQFTVYTVDSTGLQHANRAWTRLLDPAFNEGDRGQQIQDIDLPTGTIGVVLENLPIQEPGPNYGFWSQVNFK